MAGAPGRAARLDFPGSIRVLVGQQQSGALHQRGPGSQAGGEGFGQRRRKLDAGQFRIAEAGRALVVIPAGWPEQPAGGIVERTLRQREAAAPGGVKGAGAIAVVVAGKAAVVALPARHLARQILDGPLLRPCRREKQKRKRSRHVVDYRARRTWPAATLYTE